MEGRHESSVSQSPFSVEGRHRMTSPHGISSTSDGVPEDPPCTDSDVRSQLDLALTLLQERDEDVHLVAELGSLLVRERAEAKEQVDRLSQELASLRRDMRERQEEVGMLQAQADVARSTAAELQATRLDLERLRDENNRLIKRNAVLHEYSEKLDLCLSQLGEEGKASEHAAVEGRRAISAYEQLAREHQSVVGKLEKCMHRQEEMDAVQNSLRRLNERLASEDSLSGRVRAKTSNASTGRRSIRDEMKDVQECVRVLLEMAREKEVLEASLAELRTEKAHLGEEVTEKHALAKLVRTLTEETMTLKTHRQQSEREILTFKATMDGLQEALSAKQENILSLQIEIEELRHQLEDFQEQSEPWACTPSTDKRSLNLREEMNLMEEMERVSSANVTLEKELKQLTIQLTDEQAHTASCLARLEQERLCHKETQKALEEAQNESARVREVQNKLNNAEKTLEMTRHESESLLQTVQTTCHLLQEQMNHLEAQLSFACSEMGHTLSHWEKKVSKLIQDQSDLCVALSDAATTRKDLECHLDEATDATQQANKDLAILRQDWTQAELRHEKEVMAQTATLQLLREEKDAAVTAHCQVEQEVIREKRLREKQERELAELTRAVEALSEEKKVLVQRARDQAEEGAEAVRRAKEQCEASLSKDWEEEKEGLMARCKEAEGRCTRLEEKEEHAQQDLDKLRTERDNMARLVSKERTTIAEDKERHAREIALLKKEMIGRDMAREEALYLAECNVNALERKVLLFTREKDDALRSQEQAFHTTLAHERTEWKARMQEAECRCHEAEDRVCSLQSNVAHATALAKEHDAVLAQLTEERKKGEVLQAELSRLRCVIELHDVTARPWRKFDVSIEEGIYLAEAMVEALERQNTYLQRELEDARATGGSSGRLQEKEAECDLLLSKLQAVERRAGERIHALEQQISCLHKETDGTSTKLHLEQEEKVRIRDRLTSALEEVGVLRQRIENSSGDQELLTNVLLEKKEFEEELQGTLSRLQEERNRSEAMLGELNVLRARLVRPSAGLEELRREMEATNTRLLGEIETRTEELTRTLLEKEEIREEAQRSCKLLSEEVDRLRTERIQLVRNVERLSEESEAATAMQKENKLLAANLFASEEERRRLREKVTVLDATQSKLERATRECASLHINVKSLQQRLQGTLQRNEVLRRSAEAHSTEKAQFIQEDEQLQGTVVTLTKQVQLLREENGRYVSEIQHLQGRLQETTESHAHLDEERDVPISKEEAPISHEPSRSGSLLGWLLS